jgi:hypothetical protein
MTREIPLRLLSAIQPFAHSGTQLGADKGTDNGPYHPVSLGERFCLNKLVGNQIENKDPEQQPKAAAHLLSSGFGFHRHLLLLCKGAGYSAPPLVHKAEQDSKAAPACPPLSHLLKRFDDAVQKMMIF